jgi:phosphohistidine phosphatase SixA
MKVVLIRHATRAAQGLGDCPLNAVGKSQAENLATQWVSPLGPLPPPTRLIASPKKRAQETLKPLSLGARVDLETDPRLDERHQNETATEFETRVKSVIGDLSGPDTQARESCIYLCSHLDWIEAFLIHVPAGLSEQEAYAGWSAAEFRVFRIDNGFWSLKQSGAIPSNRS